MIRNRLFAVASYKTRKLLHARAMIRNRLHGAAISARERAVIRDRLLGVIIFEP